MVGGTVVGGKTICGCVLSVKPGNIPVCASACLVINPPANEPVIRMMIAKMPRMYLDVFSTDASNQCGYTLVTAGKRYYGGIKE